jgi:hypothetical protein
VLRAHLCFPSLPLLLCKPLESSADAVRTAKLVNELNDAFRAALESHPLNLERAKKGLSVANVVLFRGCGSRIRVPSFNDVHGVKAFMVAPTCIIAGLGMSLDIGKLSGSAQHPYSRHCRYRSSSWSNWRLPHQSQVENQYFSQDHPGFLYVSSSYSSCCIADN